MGRTYVYRFLNDGNFSVFRMPRWSWQFRAENNPIFPHVIRPIIRTTWRKPETTHPIRTVWLKGKHQPAFAYLRCRKDVRYSIFAFGDESMGVNWLYHVLFIHSELGDNHRVMKSLMTDGRMYRYTLKSELCCQLFTFRLASAHFWSDCSWVICICFKCNRAIACVFFSEYGDDTVQSRGQANHSYAGNNCHNIVSCSRSPYIFKKSRSYQILRYRRVTEHPQSLSDLLTSLLSDTFCYMSVTW